MKRFLAVAVFVTVAVLGENVHAQQGTGAKVRDSISGDTLD